MRYIRPWTRRQILRHIPPEIDHRIPVSLT